MNIEQKTKLETKNSEVSVLGYGILTLVTIFFVGIFYLLNRLYIPFSDIMLLLAFVGSFLTAIQICSAWRQTSGKMKPVLAAFLLLLGVVPAYSVYYLISTL